MPLAGSLCRRLVVIRLRSVLSQLHSDDRLPISLPHCIPQRMLRQDCNAKAEKRMEKVEAFRSVAGGATHATDAPRDREVSPSPPPLRQRRGQ